MVLIDYGVQPALYIYIKCIWDLHIHILSDN